MEKYIWKITNYLFFGIILIVILLVLIFAFKITVNNILYYNNYVSGIIIDIESKGASSSDGPLYVEKIYTIKDKNKIYKSTAISKSKNISIKDTVTGIKKSKNLVRILSVNSNKISNRYKFTDILALIISLISIAVLPLFLISKIK